MVMRRIALFSAALFGALFTAFGAYAGNADTARIDKQLGIRSHEDLLAHALAHRGQMVLCKPFVSPDGKAVWEIAALREQDCGNPIATRAIRVAFFGHPLLKEPVLCSHTGGRCKYASDLKARGIVRLEKLRKVWEAAPGPFAKCEAATDGESFRTEVVPAKDDFGCGNNISATLHFDFEIGVVTFFDGKANRMGQLELLDAGTVSSK